MRVPHAEKARVPLRKVTGYLLSGTHRLGRHKARFFAACGFSPAEPDALRGALRRHVADHAVIRQEATRFGTRYAVDGIMATPDGRTPRVRTVWFIGTGEEVPRFVTAYPLTRGDP